MSPKGAKAQEHCQVYNYYAYACVCSYRLWMKPYLVMLHIPSLSVTLNSFTVLVSLVAYMPVGFTVVWCRLIANSHAVWGSRNYGVARKSQMSHKYISLPPSLHSELLTM